MPLSQSLPCWIGILGVLGGAACGEEEEALAALGTVDLAVCAPENGPFSLAIDNPYLPFPIGATRAIEGLEGGTDFGRSELRVLDETAAIAGVTTRVVEMRSFEEGQILVEVTRAFYVQARDGTVCYYGEDIEAVEDGRAVSDPESWRVGEAGAQAGIAMPAAISLGLTYTMVYRPEDEIDTVEITALGESFETPAGTFDDVITVLEEGPSLKKYAKGVGQIYDDGKVLVAR